MVRVRYSFGYKHLLCGLNKLADDYLTAYLLGMSVLPPDGIALMHFLSVHPFAKFVDMHIVEGSIPHMNIL